MKFPVEERIKKLNNEAKKLNEEIKNLLFIIKEEAKKNYFINKKLDEIK